MPARPRPCCDATARENHRLGQEHQRLRDEIQPGRGFEEAARILGKDFAGILVRDGWGPYRSFAHARHQTCLGHRLRRCHENLETAVRGTARFPHAVKALLQRALALRDRRDRGEIAPHGFAVARGQLAARRDWLLAWKPLEEENRKLAAHLVRERAALFTFLDHPGVAATNWAAEQAIRPAVVTRKVCGGNRAGPDLVLTCAPGRPWRRSSC